MTYIIALHLSARALPCSTWTNNVPPMMARGRVEGSRGGKGERGMGRLWRIETPSSSLHRHEETCKGRGTNGSTIYEINRGGCEKRKETDE